MKRVLVNLASLKRQKIKRKTDKNKLLRPKYQLAIKNWIKYFLKATALDCAVLHSASRPVVPGGARGAMASPVFGRSVNPISTKGADYAHQIIRAPPDFQTFRRPCDGTWFPFNSAKIGVGWGGGNFPQTIQSSVGPAQRCYFVALRRSTYSVLGAFILSGAN